MAARLLKSRVELLDLSLRNPLLNYRSSARRGLDVVDEASVQVFARLVVEGESFRFHHTRVSDPQAAADGVFFVEEEAPATSEVGTGGENAANSLATPYTREGLNRRLLSTSADAWLSIQEQGVNTLFLALGMLSWRDEGKESRLAPLVLIPVRLDRKSARSAWQLTATEEDAGFNLSLAEKMKDLGLALPAEPPLESAEDFERLLALVKDAIADREGWELLPDRVALGFFSFGKFLMYRDLDPGTWPERRRPEDHPVLSSLLLDGFRERAPEPANGTTLDETRPPGKIIEIMDADGSQAEALAEVAAGRSLVIQGPPGTGKSQTISNLIAEAVGAGKRVLFVAEKLAALEVVKRRLENAGLGDLCLELHSNKASKKSVAADLARTLALGRPRAPEGAARADGLAELRQAINRYAEAVASPVGESGVTPFEAIGTLDRLAPLGLPKIACAAMAGWTRSDAALAATEVQDLAAKTADLGVPAKHVFEGCGLVEWMPGDRERLEALLRKAETAAKAAREAGEKLAATMGVAAPDDAVRLLDLATVAGLALDAPDLSGVPAVGAAWDAAEAGPGLAATATRAMQRRDLRSRAASRLTPEAWGTDLLGARGDLAAEGGSWFKRWFSGRYKAARAAVQRVCKAPIPKGPDELIALADLVLEARRLDAEIAKALPACRALLGDRVSAAEPRWEELVVLKDWALRFRAAVRDRRLPPSLGGWVVGTWDRTALKSAQAAAKDAAAAWLTAARELRSGLALADGGARDPETGTLAAAEAQSALWRAELAKLPSYIAYNRLRQSILRRGLNELAALSHEGRAEPAQLPGILEQAWARTAIDRALRERVELRGFDAVTHEQRILRFRTADEAAFLAGRARVAEIHWRAIPGGAAFGQAGLLKREAVKKARHLPIRRLMAQAGAALQAAKPVFLMSPLSVAAFLPPDGPTFDLVVFDEASQVKPVDAMGAIARGRQLVVVGDEKQMPPTSFFDSMMSSDGALDRDDEPETVTQDVPSILGLCASRGMPSRMLRWHYRSRHDSLIALSNREFYGNNLVVFPSPDRDPRGEGLSLRYVPDSAYERGTTRTNPKEADAVAQAVLEYSRTHPEQSVGVVAFSQAQKGALQDRIETLARKHPDFDAWTNSRPDEPFFVKNLENVQGDERDAMFISVGYGRDAAGKCSMNFGPLNQAGGERRLNVLITRARRRCIVFTNLQPDDIDVERAPGEGVRALRAFLQFAADRRLAAAAGAPASRAPGLEEQVRAALIEKGHQVELRVGSGGFHIDLAVVDPSTPGRHLLGIELDGDSYRSARWARDRDRLRDSVLRGLGWSLHRVWSADWQRNREESLARVLAAIEGARKSSKAPAPKPAGGALARASEEPPTGPPPSPRYKPAGVGSNVGAAALADLPPDKLAPFIAAIVEDEGPVHVEEVQRRVLAAADARSSPRRSTAIDEGIAAAVQRGLVRQQGLFLFLKAERPIVARDRSELPDVSRRLDYVCDEECREALLRVTEESFGCDAEEAASQALRLLGVKRSDDAAARLLGLLGVLVKEGALATSGAMLSRPR